MGGLKIVALELQWNILFAWTAVGSVCKIQWQRLPKGQEWRHFNKQIDASGCFGRGSGWQKVYNAIMSGNVN